MSLLIGVCLAGYIPNSVVRSQIGFTPPADPFVNMALKYVAFMAEMVSTGLSHTSEKMYTTGRNMLQLCELFGQVSGPK